MSQSYYVVYEYTTKSGGLCGFRVYRSFHSKAEADAEPKDDHKMVIAEGISDEEAENICLIIAEVCFMTAAIENASKDDGKIDLKSLNSELTKNALSLFYFREEISNKGLTLQAGFNKCVVGPEDTEKNQLLRWVLERYDNPLGTVNNYVAYDVMREAIHIKSHSC